MYDNIKTIYPEKQINWLNVGIYYFLMMLILVSWNNPDSLPPFIYRITYAIALLSPMIMIKKDLLPIVLFTYIAISAASYAVSYMPTDGLNVTFILLICLFLSQQQIDEGLHISMPIWVLMAFTGLTDFFFADRLYSAYSFLILAIVGTRFIDKKNVNLIHWIAFSFMVVTIVLALEFMMVGNGFTITYTAGALTFIRKGWADPNYFGCQLGVGVLMAATELLYKGKALGRWLKIICWFAIILGTLTIVETASRGAILALVGGLLCLIMFSNINLSNKIRLFIGLVIFGGILFYSGTSNLLLARFANDAGDAGGRTAIWAIKFDAFIRSADIGQWLMGVGRTGGIALGFYEGFHNDYIAFLVEYGIIGFIFFLLFLLYPLFKSGIYTKGIVLSSVSYLMLCCVSLEPITAGYLFYFYFYLFILFVTQTDEF